MSEQTEETLPCKDEAERKLKYLFKRYDASLDSTVSSGDSFCSVTSSSERVQSGSSFTSARYQRRKTISIASEFSDDENNNLITDHWEDNVFNNNASAKPKDQSEDKDQDGDTNSCLLCNALVKERQYYLWESRFMRSSYCSTCVRKSSRKRYISYWGTPTYEHGSWRKRYRNGKSTNIDLTPLIDVLRRIDNIDTSMGRPMHSYVGPLHVTASDERKPTVKYKHSDNDDIKDDSGKCNEVKHNENRLKSQNTANISKTKDDTIGSKTTYCSFVQDKKSDANVDSFEALNEEYGTNLQHGSKPRCVSNFNDSNNNKVKERFANTKLHTNKQTYAQRHDRNETLSDESNPYSTKESNSGEEQYLQSDSDSEFDDVVVKAAEFIENELIANADSNLEMKNRLDIDENDDLKRLSEIATSSRRESRGSGSSADCDEHDANYREFHDGLKLEKDKRRPGSARRRSKDACKSIPDIVIHVDTTETRGEIPKEEDFTLQSTKPNQDDIELRSVYSRRPSMQRRKGSLLDTEIPEETRDQLNNISKESFEKDRIDKNKNEKCTSGESDSSSTDTHHVQYNREKRRISRTEADLMLNIGCPANSFDDEDESFMKIRSKIENLSNLSKRIGRGNNDTDRESCKATGYLLDKYLRRARRASLKRKSSLVEVPRELAGNTKDRNGKDDQIAMRKSANLLQGLQSEDANVIGKRVSGKSKFSIEDTNLTSNQEHEVEPLRINTETINGRPSNRYIKRRGSEKKPAATEIKSTTYHTGDAGTDRDEPGHAGIEDTHDTAGVLHRPQTQSRRNSRYSNRKGSNTDADAYTSTIYRRKDSKHDTELESMSSRAKHTCNKYMAESNTKSAAHKASLSKATSELQIKTTGYHSRRTSKNSLPSENAANDSPSTDMLTLCSDDSDEQELSWRSRGYSNDFYMSRRSKIGTEIINSFNKAISRQNKHRGSKDNSSDATGHRPTSVSAPSSRKSSRVSLFRKSSREINKAVIVNTLPSNRTNSAESHASDSSSAESDDSSYSDPEGNPRRRSVADLAAAFEKVAATCKWTH